MHLKRSVGLKTHAVPVKEQFSGSFYSVNVTIGTVRIEDMLT